MSHEGSAEGFLQATHPARGEALPHVQRQIPRRTIVKGLLAALGVGAVLGFGGREMLKDHTTGQQKLARDFFDKVIPEEVVAGKVEDESGVELRDIPFSPVTDLAGTTKGHVLDHLERGAKISKSMVVWGNNVESPSDTGKRGRWLAFPNPKKPNQMVFAWAGNFNIDGGAEKFLKIEPKEVNSGIK